MAGLDLELVRQALSTARRNGYAEVEVSKGDDSFSAKLSPKKSLPKAKAPAAPADSGSPVEPALLNVTSSAVGYFREATPALKIGDRVAKGQVVGVVVALGIANDIESKVDGEVVELLVQADQPVDYNYVIAKVRP